MGYERILVPTDGSQNGAAAIDEAIDVAGKYGASVHGLYVINTSAMPSPEIQFREEFEAHGEEVGREAVAAVADAAEEAGIEATTSIRRGAPSEQILDYAEEHDVDLIVMGTHGRSGLGHVLLGSVTERVIHRSDIPVLTVRTAPD